MSVFKRDVLKSTRDDQEFFVAAVCLERGKAALVNTKDWFSKSSQYRKPKVVSLKVIESKLISGELSREGCIELPEMMLHSENWLEGAGVDKWLVQRDRNYKIIKSIIEDEDLWFRYLFGESIAEEILHLRKKLDIGSVGSIYRLLNRYVTFGSIKNALLPIAYRECGNRTVYDRPEDLPVKRGRKTRRNRHGQIVPCLSKSRGITAQDKFNILKLLKEKEISTLEAYKEFSVQKLYEEFQKRYQSHLLIRTTDNGDRYYPWLYEEQDRISKDQFSYHVRKLLSDEQKLKITLGRVNFEKDKAVKTGLARDGIIGPSYCYAIDATILDLYVRYPYNPKIKSCGRPVLYLVVDVWSTCIVGYYLGFHGPDWVGAGQALYHSFIEKHTWAKSIGWDLEPEDWPCHHIPTKIFGDNGAEFSEYNIRSLLEGELGIEMMDYAPIYRGDAKSIVERVFGALNKTFIHFEPGYVHKENLRELPHAANDSVWDFRSLLIEIGKEIVYHNNNVSRLKLHNFLMARDYVGLTPQAIYSYGLKTEMGGGRIVKEQAKLRFATLREETATVHGNCVTHNGLEYEYPNGEKSGVYGKAKYGKAYKIPVRITNASVNYIWHRDSKGKYIELRLRDKDHWARNNRREVVMERLEEYVQELYELEMKAEQERLQRNFEIEQARALNQAQTYPSPNRKRIPSHINEAKQIMIEKYHTELVQAIRDDFGTKKAGEAHASQSQDIDEELAASY